MLRWIRKWMMDEQAVAAIEAGLLFPVMVTILCGMIDMGVGLVTNQKVLNASQIIGDLLGREEAVSDSELAEAVAAGRLALQPYAADTLGTDIAGVQFVGPTLTPTVQWRETSNMSPNEDILADSEGLGLENEGVLAVTVRYVYSPYFSSSVVGTLEMEETAYVRGRNGLFVTKE